MNSAFTPALQYGTGTYIQPQFNTVTISAFSYANSYTVSAILAEYPIENDTEVAIQLPADTALEENETFALCVRYTEGSTTVRYVIHKPAWFDGILFPEYAGQKLGQSAVLEVWSLDDITPCVVASDLIFNIGPLNFQRAGQIATCGQIQGTNTTLTATVL